MGGQDWNMAMVDIPLGKLLWEYSCVHAGVTGNDWADRLASKTTITRGLRRGKSEVSRSLRHYCGHHGKDVTPSIASRIVGRGSAWQSSSKWRERAIVNPTNTRTVSKATSGKFLRDRWIAYGLFRAHRYHLELNMNVVVLFETACFIHYNTPFTHAPISKSSLSTYKVW